jgi:hypothetical protein
MTRLKKNFVNRAADKSVCGQKLVDQREVCPERSGDAGSTT